MAEKRKLTDEEIQIRKRALEHAIKITPEQVGNETGQESLTASYPIKNGYDLKTVLKNADTIYEWLTEK